MSLRKTVQTAALADASRDLTGLVNQVKAILPQFTDDVICQVLAEEDENVERAIETLLTRPEPARRPNKKKDRGGGGGGAASSASPTEPANAAANGQLKAGSSQASGDAGARGKQQQSSASGAVPADKVVEERPKTPAEKEAQKYRKKLREIEAIEERLRRGEKVDHLQEEKVQHKRDFQIQLTAAERKAEKEVAEQTAKLRKEAAEKARLEAAAKSSQANQQPSATAAVSANARRWNQQAAQAAAAPPTGQHHPPNHGESAEPQEEWPAEAGSDAQDHLLRLQQEQMHREQLERELLAEKAQREELQRQLGIERLEREQLDRLNQMRQQGHAAPILPPPQDNGRLQERQPLRTGAPPPAPPTGPPTTAPPSMPPSAAPAAAPPAAAAPVAVAAGAGGGTEQRGQELLSLLHSSTSRPDASHSYEQSANLAKQLGGGQLPYGVRPVHASPQAPPPAQGGGGFQAMQQRPVQSRQQPHEQQQPRTRETQWWPSIDSMRVDAAGSGASGQGPPRFGLQAAGAAAGKEGGEDDQQFLNQYSTPLNEMTFTKEQREAAERIAREIEKGGAGPKTSGVAHWAGDGHGHGSEWRGGRGGGRSWQHDWSDSKGGSGGKGGGKGFRRGGGGGKSAPGSS